MNVFTWIALAIAAVGLAGIMAGYFTKNEMQDAAWQRLVMGGIALGVALLIGFFGIMPEWRLYRATVEKRILVEQARAEADSAVEYKRAEITRAEGVAEANVIVAGSITEQYLRYLFVNNLGQTSNQIIYVPTEANLPILEADRLGVNDRASEDE